MRNQLREQLDALSLSWGNTEAGFTIRQTISEIDKAESEVAELLDQLAAAEAKIAQAPHAPGCQIAGLWILPVGGGFAKQQSGECTCWKSASPVSALDAMRANAAKDSNHE
jgi:hypothetical protein